MVCCLVGGAERQPGDHSSIGGWMMKLHDIMVREVATIGAEQTTAIAARKMREQSVGCLVVTIETAVKGIVTDRDLLGCLSETHDPSRCKVAAHMSRPVVVERPQEEVLRAAEIMAARRIKRLPVVEGGKLVGLVSFSDIAEVVDEEAQACGSVWASMARLIRAQSRHRRPGGTPAAAAP